MLEQLITTVITYLNASGYYKTAEEIKNAINVASLDLYKRLRGNLAQYAPGRPQAAINPEQTNVTADAISELYRTITGASINVNTGIVTLSISGRVVDIILSIEGAYNDAPSVFYPVNIVPDNQFLMMKNNPVIPPVPTRPLGRLVAPNSYEVSPIVNISSINARVLTTPNPVDFTFTESNGPIPNITIISPIDWSYDKLDNLVYGTVANLGFNLSNGVLVQSGNAMNNTVL